MKKIFSVLTLVVLGAALIFAQGAGPSGGLKAQDDAQPGKQKGGKMMQIQKEILSKLDLSKEQQADIKALYKETFASIKELREQGLSQEDARPKMKAIRQKQREGMMKILDDEQRVKYQDLWKEALQKIRKEHDGDRQLRRKPKD